MHSPVVRLIWFPHNTQQVTFTDNRPDSAHHARPGSERVYRSSSFSRLCDPVVPGPCEYHIHPPEDAWQRNGEGYDLQAHWGIYGPEHPESPPAPSRRMAHMMKKDKAFDPVAISLFSPSTVMARAHGFTELIEEFLFRWYRGIGGKDITRLHRRRCPMDGYDFQWRSRPGHSFAPKHV